MLKFEKELLEGDFTYICLPPSNFFRSRRWVINCRMEDLDKKDAKYLYKRHTGWSQSYSIYLQRLVFSGGFLCYLDHQGLQKVKVTSDIGNIYMLCMDEMSLKTNML